MKRRKFLQCLGLGAAAPVVAAAKPDQEKEYIVVDIHMMGEAEPAQEMWTKGIGGDEALATSVSQIAKAASVMPPWPK